MQVLKGEQVLLSGPVEPICGARNAVNKSQDGLIQQLYPQTTQLDLGWKKTLS